MTEASTILVVLGLCLDIVGVYLLYKHGIPSIDRRTHGVLLLENEDESKAGEIKRHDKLSKIALVILVTGFAMQAIGQLL